MLVIEDDPQVRRMLVRLMIHHFDAVYGVGSTAAADEVLGNHPITHIVLDYHLGVETPFCSDLVATWRRRYPLIGRVILLTGSRISALDIPMAVDMAISKGEDPLAILAELTGE